MERVEKMKKSISKIFYDKNWDILYMSKGRKAKHSINIDDFVFDIDNNGLITALEILDASKNLGVTVEQLASLKDISMRINYKPNNTVVTLIVFFKGNEKEIKIPIESKIGDGTTTKEECRFALA